MDLFKEVIRCRNSTTGYLKLHDHSVKNLNMLDLLFLSSVQEGKIQAKEFSASLNIDPSYISKRIRTLEKNGLIFRMKRGREKEIILTEKGKEINSLITSEKKVLYKKVLKKVSPDELETALKVLKTISKVMITKG